MVALVISKQITLSTNREGTCSADFSQERSTRSPMRQTCRQEIDSKQQEERKKQKRRLIHKTNLIHSYFYHLKQ